MINTINQHQMNFIQILNMIETYKKIALIKEIQRLKPDNIENNVTDLEYTIYSFKANKYKEIVKFIKDNDITYKLDNKSNIQIRALFHQITIKQL